MTFFDIKNIAEREMELVNPSSPDKVIRAGRAAGLRPGLHVIEFGCGYGEVLALWAEHFGVAAVGIDVREHACERARRKMDERGVANRIEIVHGNGADYECEPGTFDVAACVGATFIWGGFRPTIQAMRRAVNPAGRLVVGEVYWSKSEVPPTYARGEAHPVPTEAQLAQMARDEGFELAYVLHSSVDDWDSYEAENWRSLQLWLAENPDHPERGDVLAHLRSSQDEYLTYAREFMGWALYVLAPGQG